MKSLRENDLIFGRLMPVSEPHLIERYNKALKAFGLPETKLPTFEIDRTGFSPEIAEELTDAEYLDPKGVNRRFIILTPMQEDLPVVHTVFSNTSQLMADFFKGNRRALHALTIRDVVYGEIEDNVAEVRSIDDLLSIEKVTFRVLSAEDVLGKAAELGRLVNRLETEPDFWRDTAKLQHMVELAKAAGDIRENRLVPENVVFRHEAFWTSHFGGTFVFHDDKGITVIGDEAAPGFRRSRPWQVAYIDINDARRVFNFLSESGRLEMPRSTWVEQSGYLKHRADMVLTDLVATLAPETDFEKVDPVWMQLFKQRHARDIETDGRFTFLQAAERRLAETGRILARDLPVEHAFQVVRAAPEHRDAWLVNRLIARFVPADFISGFVFDKQGFYDRYDRLPEQLKRHVVARLKTTYLEDKSALRARLYGLG